MSCEPCPTPVRAINDLETMRALVCVCSSTAPWEQVLGSAHVSWGQGRADDGQRRVQQGVLCHPRVLSRHGPMCAAALVLAAL